MTIGLKDEGRAGEGIPRMIGAPCCIKAFSRYMRNNRRQAEERHKIYAGNLNFEPSVLSISPASAMRRITV